MPINPVNPRSREKDFWDKLEQGLQIANTILGATKTVGDIRRGNEASFDANRAREGVYTDAELANANLPTATPEYVESGRPVREVSVLVPKEQGPLDRLFGSRDVESEKRLVADIPKEAAQRQSEVATFGLEESRRKEINNDIVTKVTKEIAPAVQKIKKAAELGTAQGDVALLFSFGKLVDPNSVVRESEYSNFSNTRGLADTVAASLSRVKSGQMLTPEQRQGFVDLADEFWKIQAQAQNNLNTQFGQIASQERLSPDKIIPRFQLPLDEKTINANIDLDKMKMAEERILMGGAPKAAQASGAPGRSAIGNSFKESSSVAEKAIGMDNDKLLKMKQDLEEFLKGVR